LNDGFLDSFAYARVIKPLCRAMKDFGLIVKRLKLGKLGSSFGTVNQHLVSLI